MTDYDNKPRLTPVFIFVFVFLCAWYWYNRELCLGVTVLAMALAFLIPWALHTLKAAGKSAGAQLEHQRSEARRRQEKRRQDIENERRRAHEHRMAELEAARRVHTPVPPPPPPPPTKDDLLAALQKSTEAELTRLETMKGLTPDEKIAVRNQIIDDYLTRRAGLVG